MLSKRNGNEATIWTKVGILQLPATIQKTSALRTTEAGNGRLTLQNGLITHPDEKGQNLVDRETDLHVLSAAGLYVW